MRICISIPRVRAASSASFTYWAVAGLVARTRKAILESLGSSSVRICSRFPVTSPWTAVNPVTFPPGRARLMAIRIAIGSMAATNTTGIV